MVKKGENYPNKKGLILQKERDANLPLVEAEEEPIFELIEGIVLLHS
jgi:hypothetical protein